MCLTASCVGSPGPDQGGNAGPGSPSTPGEAWSRDGAGRLAGQNGPWSPSPSLGPPHPACKPGAFPKVTLPPEALLIATAGSNHRPRMFPRGAWGKRKPRAGRLCPHWRGPQAPPCLFTEPRAVSSCLFLSSLEDPTTQNLQLMIFLELSDEALLCGDRKSVV